MAYGEWDLIRRGGWDEYWVRPLPKKNACATCKGEGGLPRTRMNGYDRLTTYYVTCPACNGRGH